ncbi:unnamed protein product, partial [Amoebophrya sp. A25]|eukprot:GSA25T00013659001.1
MGITATKATESTSCSHQSDEASSADAAQHEGQAVLEQTAVPDAAVGQPETVTSEGEMSSSTAASPSSMNDTSD